MTRKTKARRQTDNWPAAAVSPIDSQALKMPVVKTSSAKYETVPKSASVSMSARAAPAATAGRAIGSATRQKLPQALCPASRPASSALRETSRNAVRASR